MAESSGSVVSNNINTQKQSSAVQSTDLVKENKTEKVMEPILLEDFRYNEEPKSLKNLLQFFEKNKVYPNRNDILVGLVYILMLESGFVPIEQKDSYDDCNFNYQRVVMTSQLLPKNWKKGNLYCFSFVLAPFQLYECKIACISSADDILVNCVVKGVENGHYTILLDPLTYFSSSSSQITTHKLQNLNHLSRTVKNAVCYPAKQVILRNNDIVVSCFEEIPPEIALLIMSHLKIEDLVHLGQTNSFFYELMKTPKLWINLLKVDFKKEYNLHSYEQLRNFYKSYFEIKLIRNRRERW